MDRSSPGQTDDAGLLVDAGDLSIRRMRDDDADYLLMSRWLTDERVLEFVYGRDNPHDLPRVREKFGPRARGQSPVVPCILVHCRAAVGYIQYYAVNGGGADEYGLETAEDVYGVDLFIGEPDLWNRGIGTRALSAMVGYLFDEVDARRVVIDPHVANIRAVRCYEKCGFQKVRILPEHELHEGERRDSWLMAIDRDGASNHGQCR